MPWQAMSMTTLSVGTSVDKHENISGKHKAIKLFVQAQGAVDQYGMIGLNLRTAERGKSINTHSKHFSDSLARLPGVRSTER